MLKENVIFQEENVKTFGSKKKKNLHSGKCFKCENIRTETGFFPVLTSRKLYTNDDVILNGTRLNWTWAFGFSSNNEKCKIIALSM